MGEEVLESKYVSDTGCPPIHDPRLLPLAYAAC